MTPAWNPRAATRAAWLVVVLLWPVALLNYLDRQMLAAMKSSVMGDIPSIGREENWGLIAASFKWVYAVLSPIGGYIADRFSRRITICVSLFVWSCVTWATGHVHTFDALIVTRALMGISEACYFPAALALIADHHLGGTRSRAVGMHQMAIYVGVIIGGFGGYVADAPRLGWRFAFDACGIVGVIYAIPLWTLLRDAPRPREAATGPGFFRSTKELLTTGSFLLLIAYFALPSLPGWVIRDWMPAVLKQKFQVGQGISGVAATLPLQLAAILSAFVGGWLADRWMRRTDRGRIYVSAIGMSLFIPALFGVGNATSLTMAVCFLALFGIGWAFFDGNNMPILCQIARPELRATGYGLLNFFGISCGGVADWAFGVMRDRHVPLNVSFGVFASLAALCVVLVLRIHPKREIQ